MRKNFGAKPLLYPMPVFILAAYDEKEVPCAMNAAWGCILDYDEILISLGDHKTTDNILLNKAFTVSIADAKHVIEADYVGIVSGNKVPNKVEIARLHTTKSEYVNAPIIEEFPITLECTLKSFEDGELVGKIKNVSVDEAVLDENGKVDYKKVDPITYDPFNHTYIRLGEVVGKAFSDGKKLMK